MEHWCTEPDSGRPEYSERSLKQCYFAHGLTWDRTRVSAVNRGYRPPGCC